MLNLLTNMLTDTQKEFLTEILAKKYHRKFFKVNKTNVCTVKPNVFAFREILDKHGFKDIKIHGKERLTKDRFDVRIEEDYGHGN